INKLINKINKDNIFLFRAYARKGEKEKREIEIYHAIFFFEKNCRKAANEVARFIAHYSPQDWTFNGQPIKDRTALARKWTVENPQDKAFQDAHPLAYLREVYIALMRQDHPDRWMLFDQVTGMRADATAEGIVYTYRCSPECQELITDSAIDTAGIAIRFVR
ncbi:MAG: hypothetical protein NC115_12050, partial [Bacteroidales bacterium]|nr:hypothetical protein [Bacteroidales bacterium]